MSRQERHEVPEGYIWKKCAGADMLVPMPATWFFMPSPVPGILAYGFAPNLINKHGFFDTALSINVMPKLQRSLRISPEDLARRSLLENPSVTPLGEIEVTEDSKFVTARGQFEAPAHMIGNIQVSEQWYHIDHTVNKNTGTFYSIMFNSPQDQRERYEDIAKVMVEQRVLNRNF